MLGCIAVWKPKGVNIARKYLQNCYANNKEGAGFAIAKDGKIEIHKGFFSFDDFWKAYQGLQKYAALLHFRIATHGVVNADNCHPFDVSNGKYALVHNGILPSSLHKDDKNESDSKQFAKLLEPLLEMVPFGHEGFGKVVGEAIGYNKIALMNVNGKVWLFNEQKGTWNKGVWYSNSGYAYGPIKRAWKGAQGSVSNMWNSLASPTYRGFGTASNPVYSSLHRSIGYYDYVGDWVKVRDYEPQGYYDCNNRWITTGTPRVLTDEDENEAADAAFNAAFTGSYTADDSEREPTDEEIAAAGEARTLAELEGDLEFAPETEQERHVAFWLKQQEAKAREFRDLSKTKAGEKPIIASITQPSGKIIAMPLLNNRHNAPAC
jgi:hypothetical protein